MRDIVCTLKITVKNAQKEQKYVENSQKEQK